MARRQYDKTYVFAQMPVGSAVAYLVVPTVLTQVISILYNLADTFFIGQLGDPALVAAGSVVNITLDSILCPAIAPAYGWQGVFLFVVVFAAVALVLFMIFCKMPTRAKPTTVSRVRSPNASCC